ncbi:GH92 family glycosyl hydrolase [Phocaeicola plebeius]|jgi:predicted alpha-1,2-mannosidase|uniref:Glycoside hydrolase family 92 protein n=3 Tax=Phocaeicola plebeius TaxID=310297 RepID=A0A415T6M9_9BACT|nr:GH92 family glycosyl hydrolase [Phocaeicola plebeius]MBS4810561.1 GH92 family glycosyl hydrolase [Bacteroides sp.]MBS4824765.1 GH92 family glycosyl hydrolase [Bacteroides sp.]RHA32383.1 glycoside hydrolase family 92 protein [Phocaeicola plebeius]RHA35870.1 glycoside hydrolase family 92 protein [Phocaeicola plebeius]RHM97329.1 glycoside hydrolase family 92 protein [Phocaeicola plebeius]
MNKKSLLFVPVLSLCLASCGSSQKGQEMEDLTQFVDPRIGTGGHGHVFYGANVPYGFIQLGPTSIPQSWDWVSGYHVSDSTVIGFPHTHLSGTGIGDLHDINVMPVVGEVTYSRGDASSYETGLWSYSDRSKEVVTPGYYRTHLSRYNVDVELTATKRVGFHKYTFLGNESPAIVFDMVNGGCWDKTTEAVIRVVNDSTVSGYRYSKGWADDQRVFFRAEFSRKFDNVEFIVNDSVKEGDMAKGAQLFARVNFAAGNQEPVYMKVALSPTSEEGAQLNMQTELSGWDFEKTIADAKAAWNKELNKVKVYTTDEASKKIFYTSLYHTLFAPSEFCDVNGDYYGADKQMHKGEGFVNYTTFSLWDTYRAAQPLMTILHPEKMSDIINTMLHIHQQQGKLPVWHLMGCETNCMVGNPGVPVVADAILKDIKGFDTELAFKALKESSMLPERGMEHRIEYGFIPADKMTEAIAYDMEYAIADWAVAQAAQKLGKQEDYEYFLKRSKSYKNYFDASTGFMRGKMLDGSWRTPFSPYASSHREDDYCEGNAWQYTWLVPHDVEGLVECFGSKEAFVNKLDSLFLANGDMGEASSPDISGLIGQYAHGNEPSHHTVYLYTLVGQPWKTADRIKEILHTMYTDQPDGLSGNEDVGQMSAWYILSSFGFYQVEPAGGKFVFGYPNFDKVEIAVPAGKFVIERENKGQQNNYIQGIVFNGTEYKKPWIEYADIMKGGELKFLMGDEPVVWF